MEKCQVDGCESPADIKSAQLCRKHYMRMWRKGSTDDDRKNARGTCSVVGCGDPHQARGLCYRHWKAQRSRSLRLAKKTADPRACAHCGATVPPDRMRRGPVSYCSRECKDKAWVASGGNRKSALKWYYQNRYGLTQDEVAEMLAAQGGGCAICGNKQPKGKHSGFHVDHCHNSNRVRGILCHGCNVSLGHFRDDPTLLRRAADYLEREPP